MRKMSVWIKGIQPLLMHDCRGVNPTNRITKEIKKLTSLSAKAKTDEISERITRLEWENGLYLGEDGKPMIPSTNIEAAIRDAARENRKGKDIVAGLKVSPDEVPLIYKGPTDKNGLWEAGFSDVRIARVERSRVPRCRPRFNNWELRFVIEYSEKEIEDEAMKEYLVLAGSKKGLGDYRPKFGRFSLMSLEPAE